MFVLTNSLDIKMMKEKKYKKDSRGREQYAWHFEWANYYFPLWPSHSIIHEATIFFLFIFDHSAILLLCRGGGGACLVQTNSFQIYGHGT